MIWLYNEAVRGHLRKHLFRHLKRMAFFNLVVAIFIAFFLYLQGFVVPGLSIWLIVMAVVVMLRFMLAWLAVKDASHMSYKSYHVLSLLITALIGFLWGYAYVAFYDDINVFMRMFILLILAGVTAGTTATLAGSVSYFCAFIFPLVLLIAWKCIVLSNIQSISVLLVMLIYVWFLISLFVVNRRMLLENVQLMLKQNELIQELNLSNQKLAITSMMDGLTGVANIRYFRQRLKEDWERAKRSQVSMALLFIDVDYFKGYNDHYGHLAGDECLKTLARLISEQAQRETDLAARYGGDEFVVLLYDTDLSGAQKVAKAIEQAVKNQQIKHAGSPISDRVTVSIGISFMQPSKDNNSELLIMQADKALYQAKENGRNTIFIA